MWLSILAVISKLLDLINPWSAYWVDRSRAKDKKKADALAKMDEASKKGDYDTFLDGRADKHSAS